MRNVLRKSFISLLILSMMAGTLTGCGKGNKAGAGVSNQTDEKGRYEEKEMQLPEEVDKQDIFNLQTEDGVPVFYVTTEPDSETVGIKRYVYDGTWKEDTPDCIKNVMISNIGYSQIKVMKQNQNYLLYYTAAQDESYHGELLLSRNGAEFELVTPASWLEENEEYHFIDMPQDVAVNSDGVLLAMFYTKMILYNINDMSVIREWEPKDSYYGFICVNGKNFVIPGQNDMGRIDDLYVFDGTSDKELEKLSFSPKESGNLGITSLSDGTLIIACPDGMYRKNADSDKFELFINGAYTSFPMSSVWCQSIIAYDTDKYMATFGQNSNDIVIYNYEFNSELSNTPDKELTVYTLYSNSTLSQAAAVFTRKHPETLVTINVAFPNKYPDDYDGVEDIAEELKKLNASLLAKGGEDVLVLDYMNATTLVDKGCLVDLSDVINPMIDSGDLIGNIMEGEKLSDGTLPKVPLRFAMDIVVARGLDAGTVSDMKSLTEVMGKNKQSMIGPRTSDDLIDMFAPYFTDAIVKDKKLDEEELKTNLAYLKQIADNCGIVKDYGDAQRGYSIWEIASKIDIAIENAPGFAQTMFPLSGARLVKGSFSSFENAYYPLVEIAVNSNSANQELAKEFIALAVSEEVQDCDFYDGFPINAKSLEHLQHMDYSNYEAYTEIEVGDGQYEGFTIAKFNEEEGQKISELCMNLNKRAYTDTMISGELKKAVPDYFAGSKSLDDTVKEIEEALHIYLAE